MGFNSSDGDDLKSDINVTPMVDVMLVLLIIFMVAAPLMNTTGVEVALPKASIDKALVDDSSRFILSIDASRHLYIAGQPIKWESLETTLRDSTAAKAGVFVEADATLPYAVVVTAMALAQNAGVVAVQLLTDPGDHLDVKDLDAK